MMARQFDLLVFDWDGTLMDSAGVIAASIQAACRDIGLAEPGEDEARHVIGLGLTEALTTLLPGLASADYGRLVERYRYHFLSQDEAIPLFSGVPEAIAALSEAGFLLAVATGKSRRGLDRALGHTGLASYFHATRCADECFSKPHPQMLLELMDVLGAEPAKTLMIGDTSHDLQMAANAGVPSLGAGYGAHPGESLLAYGPLACAGDFSELNRWLQKNA